MAINLSGFHSDIKSFLEDAGYQVKEPSKQLFIAKTTSSVVHHYIPSEHGRLNLKGLIFEVNDQGTYLVAPGCPVPLDTPKNVPAKRISKARDGILYRFYYYHGNWQFSTTGCIVPNTYWGPPGTPTFQELCQSAIDAGLVDLTKLVPGRCYFAILESPQFTNLVKHDQLQLILTDIIDCTSAELNSVPLEQDHAFQQHELDLDLDLGTSTELGYIVHYDDGDLYRQESDWSIKANRIKPNLPDPTSQYVYLIQSGRDSQEPLIEFLEYFPWKEQIFQQLDEKFQQLVEILTENYRLIKTYGWTRVCIPSRHVRYMHHLIDECNADPNNALADVRAHLLMEDLKRVVYLLVDPQLLPQHRSQQQPHMHAPIQQQQHLSVA